MKNRRGFLALLGLAGPAAVLAPKLGAEAPPLVPDQEFVEQTTVVGYAPPAPPPDFPPPPAFVGNMVQTSELAPMRYLGLAQIKNEGSGRWLSRCSLDHSHGPWPDPGWPMTERKWDDPWPKREGEA
jgi:hypothetical protein